MLPVQSKMARAALGWNVHGVPGLSGDTVSRFEKGNAVPDETVAKLRAAYEAAGLEFIDHNGLGEGIRWREPPKKRKPAKAAAPAKRKK